MNNIRLQIPTAHVLNFIFKPTLPKNPNSQRATVPLSCACGFLFVCFLKKSKTHDGFTLLASVRTFSVTYDHTFLNLQSSRLNIPHIYIKWGVTLVIESCHFNLPQCFVWVCRCLVWFDLVCVI